MSEGPKKRGRPRIRPKRLVYQTVGRGVPIRGQSRQLVYAAREFFQREKDNGGPLMDVSCVIKRTAAALGVGRNTVMRVCKERQQNIDAGGDGLLKTPNKNRTITARVTGLDAFQKDAIRRHVYSYYFEKKYPTLDKLKATLEEADLFVGSRSSLRKVLIQLGFKYAKLNSRKVLLERPDIVASRCRFLREIRKVEFDNVVWLDETWVNTNHSVTKSWTDNSSSGTMNVPLGKGSRLILLHAGSSKGFVPNCKLLFS